MNIKNLPYTRKSFRNEEMILTINFGGDGYCTLHFSNLLKRLKFRYANIFEIDMIKFLNNIPEEPNIRDILIHIPEYGYYTVHGLSEEYNPNLTFVIQNNLLELPPLSISYPMKKKRKLSKELKSELRKILY